MTGSPCGGRPCCGVREPCKSNWRCGRSRGARGRKNSSTGPTSCSSRSIAYPCRCSTWSPSNPPRSASTWRSPTRACRGAPPRPSARASACPPSRKTSQAHCTPACKIRNNWSSSSTDPRRFCNTWFGGNWRRCFLCTRPPPRAASMGSSGPASCTSKACRPRRRSWARACTTPCTRPKPGSSRSTCGRAGGSTPTAGSLHSPWCTCPPRASARRAPCNSTAGHPNASGRDRARTRRGTVRTARPARSRACPAQRSGA
mmetsp:Transcript_67452/g.206572  ORF Transcript_67452/g.206572 Transcript_67452/m.206572 type:complete len:258 (-) Transcript_67452:431-1204(-)